MPQRNSVPAEKANTVRTTMTDGLGHAFDLTASQRLIGPTNDSCYSTHRCSTARRNPVMRRDCAARALIRLVGPPHEGTQVMVAIRCAAAKVSSMRKRLLRYAIQKDIFPRAYPFADFAQAQVFPFSQRWSPLKCVEIYTPAEYGSESMRLEQRAHRFFRKCSEVLHLMEAGLAEGTINVTAKQILVVWRREECGAAWLQQAIYLSDHDRQSIC